MALQHSRIKRNNKLKNRKGNIYGKDSYWFRKACFYKPEIYCIYTLDWRWNHRRGILGDTTQLEQADNDVSTIEHEFGSSPLYETITLGDKTFTCECIDFQNPVLKNLLGWEVTESGDAFAPVDYKDLYCKVEMEFNSTEDIVVLPKLKMNSKAMLASMKTDVSRATISGTCYPAFVKAGSTEKKTDFAIISATNKGTYTVKAEATGL